MYPSILHAANFRLEYSNVDISRVHREAKLWDHQPRKLNYPARSSKDLEDNLTPPNLQSKVWFFS